MRYGKSRGTQAHPVYADPLRTYVPKRRRLNESLDDEAGPWEQTWHVSETGTATGEICLTFKLLTLKLLSWNLKIN